jgi:serine/threonine-protein kinase RsbW
MMQVSGQTREQDMSKTVTISLSIPRRPEYISLCRLTVGAIGSREGLDGETIADLKVAVTEAATLLMDPQGGVASEGRLPQEDGSINLDFGVSPDTWTIEVWLQGSTDRAHIAAEGGQEEPLGLTILRALVDVVEEKEDPERGTVLQLVKYLSDSSPSG